MLDTNQLRQRCSNGERFRYLYFWGHQPSKDGTITHSCMSQWYAVGFEIDGVRYATAEHWMMASKARLFGDDETLQQIRDCHDPKTAKALGRGVKNFDSKAWNAVCRELVIQGNLAKFQQDERLRAYLISTDDHVLVEASPLDTIWGIGLGAADEKAKHPETWNGLNLLGFALMEVRRQLQN